MFNLPSQHLILTLQKFGITVPDNGIAESVGHLTNDSRTLVENDIFCAVIGTQSDGNQYIEQALNKGCCIVIAECCEAKQHGDITWLTNSRRQSIVQVAFYQLSKRLYDFSEVFYQSPQSKMTLIGITGTNGKTSTSQLIARLLDSCQASCAVIGTNGAGFINQFIEVSNTTPGPTELHQHFMKFVAKGATHVAMEVSSHALDQVRIKPSSLNIAVFTNLTRDHLDYHGSMESYADAKFQIFSQQEQQLAIINGDDCYAKMWLNNWSSKQPIIVYGFDDAIACFDGFVQAKNLTYTPNGVDFTLVTHLGDIAIQSPLLGAFNVENLLAAIAVLIAENKNLSEIARAIGKLTPIEGRMESFSSQNKPLAVVDYAHTPDALQKALQACRMHCQGKLWVVFGCGGDRDKGKRPLMGEIADKFADRIVVTNDNPRTESEHDIVDDIVSAIANKQKLNIILNRHEAVEKTLFQAKAGDVVLLAGKGHEDYIIIGNEKQHYNERQLVRTIYTNEVTL